MGRKPSDVWQGTLALMVFKTLDTMGAMHGYGIARRIEQTSGDRLSVNYGTLVSRRFSNWSRRATSSGSGAYRRPTAKRAITS